MGIIFENVNHGRKMAWTFLQNCFPNFGLKHIWMYIELVMYLFDNTSQPLTKLLYMLSSLKMWKLEWLINLFIKCCHQDGLKKMMLQLVDWFISEACLNKNCLKLNRVLWKCESLVDFFHAWPFSKLVYSNSEWNK